MPPPLPASPLPPAALDLWPLSFQLASCGARAMLCCGPQHHSAPAGWGAQGSRARAVQLVAVAALGAPRRRPPHPSLQSAL